jgi:ferrous iron transport protein B
LRDLFVGEYGVITLGIRYAVALILPIVTFFFIIFSIIEDTGYLPRLAMLIDRVFKKIGLSGRAVIPMVLGFGCDTMATMVTRTLPTKRERIISTLLLALAIPCSAQLGVILALLSGRPLALTIWAGVVGLVFLLVGYLAAQVLPGEKPSFYMELPPLRWPQFSNVLIKTYVRAKWYFNEVLPLFLIASVFIWLGQLTHLFDLAIRFLLKPVALIGLPPEAAKIFLFGFFRRDYGAAGLYDLNKHGALNGVQLVVASAALTLFLPCIAQFLMNVKERGWKTGLGISVFILFLSFGAAYGLNFILTSWGVKL